MAATRRRWIPWLVAGTGLVLTLVYAFRPTPVPVDLAPATRRPLVVTVDEEGETRVRDVYVLSAPVTGRLRRIEAEAGDAVVAGESVLAEIEPVDPGLLDPRSEAQAAAELAAAEAARALAEAELEQARAELDFAEAELRRMRGLAATKDVSARALDDAVRRDASARAAVATARARLDVAAFEVLGAEARLLSPVQTRAQGADCECIPLHAPVDGQVLRVLRESESVVPAGEPLVEVGDPGALEIVADYLSSDAVRIAPGQRVLVEQWGGERPLDGRVRRVEPFGFRKVSALGIEEQRVDVVADLTSPREAWTRLGHGYQVEVRVVLWEADDVLQVPLTALFRHGEAWAVFVEEDGRARLRTVHLGHRTGLAAEILEGVESGERIVVSPSDRVVDGVLLEPRR